MGLREDLERFREVGEEERQDLSEFIKHGDMSGGDNIKIPIKIIELPQFEYDKWDSGGVGQGEGEQGGPVGQPEGDGESDEAGEGGGEHGYYDMGLEEFAEELDKELGLDLDPKGKQVKEEVEGHLVERARAGPDSTLDFERMYKKGMKRSLSVFFDEDYLREVLRVDGYGATRTFEWARDNSIAVSKGWLETEYQKVPDDEKDQYSSIDDIDITLRRKPTSQEMQSVALRNEDKRHKYPEIEKEYEKNAVIVFIRDVSGSMGEHKRELVERVFTPLDWYLTGKYDQAEFIYIAHDSTAWETERDDFFGIQSGGGTKISSAYELAEELLDGTYPFREWNRYVFASGDGENWRQDTKNEVIPLMEDMDVNLHAYLQVERDAEEPFNIAGDHAEVLDEHFDDGDNVAVTKVKSKDGVTNAIYDILSTEDNDDD